ncbi:Gfo/Idh/MocA family protein [Magnetococcales bacterium HHB-1]
MHNISEQRLPLRAAVIGVGYLGQFHAQKYQQIEDTELIAVVDADRARAKEIGEKYQAAYYTDFKDILGDVDLVSIGVPTVAHFEVAKACLEAGVHVLVEKPITATLNEADDLIALAQKQDLILQVGHLKRFHPAVMALRKSGYLQTPGFIESRRLAPFKSRSLDIDVVMDLMIHDIDLILSFVSSEIIGIEAVGAPVLTDKVDIANARLKFMNGCIANITVSRISGQPQRNIRFFQDNAYIYLDFIKKEIMLMEKTEGRMMLDGIEVPEIKEQHLPIDDYDTLEMEIRAFCQAVRREQPLLVSGYDGRKALEVVMAVRESIQLTPQSLF